MQIDNKRLAILTFGVVGVLVLFAVTDPTSWRFFPKCLLHSCTGLNCPGCGTTRALRALAHGDVATALRFNALTMLALPFVGYLVVRRRDTSTIRPFWVWLTVIAVIGFGILRNIPAYPFTLLAPPIG